MAKIKQLLFGQSEQSFVSSIGLLFLRLYVGMTMFGGGLDKVPMPDWFIEQVANIGFPFPTFFAYAALTAEFIGGLLLALGILSRISAFFLAITFFVAAFVFGGTSPIVQINIAQLYFWSFVALTLIGPGKFSLDHLIKKGKAAFSFDKKSAGVIAFALAITFLGIYQMEFAPKEEYSEENAKIEGIYLAGNFNEWDPSSTQLEETSEDVFEKEVFLKNGGPIEFKIAANGNWDLNWGAENDDLNKQLPTTGKLLVQTSQNIKVVVPLAGVYRFIFDLKNESYQLLAVEK